MNQKLPEVFRSLQRAKEAAERRLVEIETEQREIKASLKSLNAALRALGSPEQAAIATKKKAATTAEVIDLIAELLSTGGELTADELAEGVAQKLLERQQSRAGLRLRLKQALKNERFTATENGYTLRSDSPADRTQQRGFGQAEK